VQQRNLETIHAFIASRASKSPAASGDVPVAKAAARQVMASIVKVDRSGKPVNPIDALLVKTLIANRPKILKGLEASMKGGTFSPLDAYEVYYKVLSDSGALGAALPDPAEVRRLDHLRANCGCETCGVCVACGVCAVSVVEAVVATGVVGALVGYVL
jgi:hypothetical protein